MIFAIVEGSAEVTRSAELWMGVLSAILGCISGGIGSVIALWADRRKRKMEQKRDLTRSERMGLARVDVKKVMEMRYSSVPEPTEEDKASKSESPKGKGGETCYPQPTEVPRESRERIEVVNYVQGMIRGLKSGIVVITGPNNTGKETLLCRAVASCMPYVDDDKSDGRWHWAARVRRRTRQGNVSFYRVKDMTRKWGQIKSEILEWFSIRAEKLMTKTKICVLYLDFHSLSKKRAAQAVENVKELYYDIGKLGQAINFVLAVKITNPDPEIESRDVIRSFRLPTLLPSQMEAIQESLEAVKSKRMDRRRLLEFTEGRIGRLMSILQHDASANKVGVVPDYICGGWFESDDAKNLERSCLGRGMALIYLVAAMARRMGLRTKLDVRALVTHVVGMADDGYSFDEYRTILRNALLSSRTDLSSVRLDNLNMEDHDFWDMFLSGWGAFGKYDFIDDLHCIIRSLQADDKLRPCLLLVALGVSDALIESSYSISFETSVQSVIVERFSVLMKQIEVVQGFERTFHVAFARSFTAWLWRRIGFIENDRILESVTNVATVCGRKALDVEILVEFMPVLVIVCKNPANWFGGNRWWTSIDVPTSAAGHGGAGEVPADVAETFLLVVSFLGLSLSHMKRFVEDMEVIREVGGFIRTVRHVAYRHAREEVRRLVRTLWRISAEAYLQEKGCYQDREYAEKEFLSLTVRLLEDRELWVNTRFSHLIPALVRELKLDSFTFSPASILGQLTAGIEITTENTSEIYERCYMQTLAGLLQAYRNYYGTSSVAIIDKLYNKLQGEKTGGVHLSKAVLDVTQTFEPEKFRCLIWILSNAVKDVHKSCGLKDEYRRKLVRDLIGDALALQKDLTDQYRAYCFRYLSRICDFMGETPVDGRPSDLYVFLEALSLWLHDSGILQELRDKDKGGCSRHKNVMSPLAEIFANVRSVFYVKKIKQDRLSQSTADSFRPRDREPTLWEGLEKIFHGRQRGDFVNSKLTEFVLMDAKAFVKDTSAECREALIRRIAFVQLDEPNGGLRRKLKRIADLSFARTVEGLSNDLPDEDFYDRFFSLLGTPEEIKVDVAVVWDALAYLVAFAQDATLISVKTYDFVRRMEKRGMMRYNYQTDLLYYYGLANNAALLDMEGHEDWCSSFVNTIPYERGIRNAYIQLTYRLRDRLKDGVDVARKAILDLVACPNAKLLPTDYEWRISTLFGVQDILEACLSEEELRDVRRFVLEASRLYKPTEEYLCHFMQEIMHPDISHCVETICEVSEKLPVEVECSSSFHMPEGKVDVAMKSDACLLLLDVLPDEDYEVEGTVGDECRGTIGVLRAGVISIGFVGTLRKVRESARQIYADCEVHIGVVASAKTLKNIRRAIANLGIHGLDLHMLEYGELEERMEAIFTGRRVESLQIVDPPDLKEW